MRLTPWGAAVRTTSAALAFCSTAALAQVPAAPTPEPVPTATAAPEAPSAPIELRKVPGLPGRAAAMLVSGPRGGTLTLTALAIPSSVGLGNLNLAVVVDIDPVGLLPENSIGWTRYVLGIYAINPEGKVDATSVYGFRLDSATVAGLGGRGIKAIVPLTVPRETVTVRVLLRDEAGAFGLVEAPPIIVLNNVLSAVPSDSGTGDGMIRSSSNREDARFLSPPVFLEAAKPWQRAVLPPGVSEPDLPIPEQAGTVAATLPVLQANGEATMWAMCFGLPQEVGTMRVRIGNRDGHEVKSSDVPIAARRPAGVGMERVEISFTVPSLEPDTYSVELSATGAAAGLKFLSYIPFVIAAPQPGGATPSWVQLNAAVAAPAAARATATTESEDESAPAIRDGYRAALGLLPTQGYPALLAAIGALERETLLKGTSFELDRVLRGELAVARKVTGKEPKGLLVLIRMHAELLGEYNRAKSYIPAAHARRMVEELAFLLAKCGDEPRKAAAQVMAALGNRFQNDGMHGSAERLLRRALSLDDTNADALLGLAAGLERAGSYRLAANTLESLVKAHPEHAEGRLRLAITLTHTNRSGEAHAHRKICMAEANPDWVRAVAFQEEARALLDDHKLEAATALLQNAIGAIPGDFHLRVLLVAALDRQHRFLDAARAVEELRHLQLGREASARLRYAEWPQLDLQDSLRELHAMDPDAVEALKTRVLAESQEQKR